MVACFVCAALAIVVSVFLPVHYGPVPLYVLLALAPLTILINLIGLPLLIHHFLGGRFRCPCCSDKGRIEAGMFSVYLSCPSCGKRGGLLLSLGSPSRGAKDKRRAEPKP